MKEKIYKTCVHLITLLAKQDWDGLAAFAELEFPVAQLWVVLVDLNNLTIVHPPDGTLQEYVDAFPMKDDENTWAVIISLWATIGQCDLDLKTRMKDTEKDLCDVVITDIDAG